MASEVAKLAIAGSDESVFSRAFRWIRRALSSPSEETALTIGASQVPRDYPADYPQNTVTPSNSLEKEDGTRRRPPMESDGVPVEYREVPSISFTEWDRVPEIRSILRELEQGYFQRASLLSVLQERDDRIAGTWATRINTLLGTPLEMEPALIDGYVTEESADVADAAEVDWSLIFPEGSLDRLFKQGVDVGLSVGELVIREDEETGRWVPHLKTWHSQWVWWNWGTESYWLNTSGAYDEDGNPVNDGAGVIELPRIDRNVYSDGHWVIYTPFGYRYAFQRGLIRATSMLHLKRQWDFRDWARYNEVYGLLIRVATVPAEASEPDKTRFANSIRNMGSEALIEAPVDGEGRGFGVEIKGAPNGSGNDTFGTSLHYLDECIGNVILGQSAAGEKKTGLGDGQANQDEAVRQDVLERDAKSLYGALRQQVLSWWTEWNFGDKRLTPNPVALTQPPESDTKRAEKLERAGAALQSVKAALPTADIGALADELGIPMLAPGEEPVHSEPDGDEVNGEESPGVHDENPPTPRIPGTQREQLRALSAKRRKRPPTYADRLSAEATAHGARIMAPDVKDILRIIRDANGPEELRAALTAKYRSMNPVALADLVERAQVMAALAGRHEVLDGIIGRSGVAVLNDQWDESKHPRADDGKFGSGGGSHREPSESRHGEDGQQVDEAAPDKKHIPSDPSERYPGESVEAISADEFHSGGRQDAVFSFPLYRAADDDYAGDGTSFAEKKSTALEYLDNPGYGGENLWKSIVTVQRKEVLDLTEMKMEQVEKFLGIESPGAIGVDEWIPQSSEAQAAARKKGFRWITVAESFPEDTRTWQYIGSCEDGDCPKMKQIKKPA